MDRRRFLYGSSTLALYTAMGGGLRAAEGRRRPKIKRFIFVNLRGAPSQMETFDAKPNHRNGGPTQGIETQIPGLYFSQHFEGLAEYSNQMSLVHTTSRIGAHQLGQHYVSTGGFLPTQLSSIQVYRPWLVGACRVKRALCHGWSVSVELSLRDSWVINLILIQCEQGKMTSSLAMN